MKGSGVVRVEKEGVAMGSQRRAHSFALPDPLLDSMSCAFARASVVVRSRADELIERPRDLIETPQ
jgi:hypothetical protein